jgi:hypothetical protein
MKYEVIKGCVIAGKSSCVGDIVELDERLARSLMGIGRVTPLDESKTVNRAVGVEGGEEKPKRRTRKPKVEEEKEAE